MNYDMHSNIISNIEENDNNSQFNSIDQLIPLAIGIMKDNNEFVDSAHKLGRYEPFIPKAGKVTMFPFKNKNLDIAVHIKKETDNISYIYIGKNEEKLKIDRNMIMNWNFQYVGKVLKEPIHFEEMNTYLVSYIYKLEGNSNIRIDFNVNNLSKDQGELLVAQKLIPNEYSSVLLYYKNN